MRHGATEPLRIVNHVDPHAPGLRRIIRPQLGLNASPGEVFSYRGYGRPQTGDKQEEARRMRRHRPRVAGDQIGKSYASVQVTTSSPTGEYRHSIVASGVASASQSESVASLSSCAPSTAENA